MRRFAPAVYLVTGAIIGALAVACTAGANQPNMQAALGSLQAATWRVAPGRPNKGGHRERALNFVNSAIAETEAGMNYAGNLGAPTQGVHASLSPTRGPKPLPAHGGAIARGLRRRPPSQPAGDLARCW